MIITLSGITGGGKSYYKNFIVKNFNAENMVIYTTRRKRKIKFDEKKKKFLKKKN